MNVHTTIDRVALLKKLREKDFIAVTNHLVYAAGLNPRENSGLYAYMPDIIRLMHEVLRESGIQFDAIASVPTGGNEYADGLQTVVESAEQRRIPRIFLNKNRSFQAYERTAAKRGARVLVVDDCVLSGCDLGSVETSLQSAGFQVEAHIVVADLNYQNPRPISAPVLSAFSSAYLKQRGISF